MEEKIVLTQEEMNELKALQEQGNQIIMEIGTTEVHLYNIVKQKKALENALEALKEKEEAFGNSIQSKYGAGSIDITTGEFTKSA